MSAPRVLLVNDTSRWHVGSKAATASVVSSIEQAGGIVVRRIATNRYEPIDVTGIDAVVVNGEGSFHDDRKWPRYLLDWIDCAHVNGIPSAVVNTMWCRMGAGSRAKLANADLVIFRDTISRADAGISDAPAYPDAALMAEFDARDIPREGRWFGLVPDAWGINDTQRRLVPRTGEWHEFIATVAGMESYTTREHHGCLAAIIANTPLVAMSAEPLQRGWKNEGLLAWGGDEWRTNEVSDTPLNVTALREAFISQRHKALADYPRLLAELWRAA